MAHKYPIEGYTFEPEQIASDAIPDHENLSAPCRGAGPVSGRG